MGDNKTPASGGGAGVRDERYDEYFKWKGDRTAKGFIGYIKNVRGVIKLSHSGILKDAGIAESLARSNPIIKDDLEGMDRKLVMIGHIPDPDQQHTPDTLSAAFDEPDNSPEDDPIVGRALVDEVDQPVFRSDVDWDYPRLELGYAIICHKVQGSQFPKVIVPIMNSLGTDDKITCPILDMAWPCTAITRAEHEAILVGQACRRKVRRDGPPLGHKDRWIKDLRGDK